MSGHNKWSKIKHKKEAVDAKKSKLFAQHARAIQTVARTCNNNINSPELKNVVQRAKSDNMPNENIERAIKKGFGNDAEETDSVLYEVYGPGGVAIIIEGKTNNKNRTNAEIKHILSKSNISLSPPNSALWAFKKVNDLWEPLSRIDLNYEDKNTLKTLVESITSNEDVTQVITNAN